MEFIDILSCDIEKNIITEIKNIISLDNNTFFDETSLVYNTQTKENELNGEIRKSKRKSIKDKEILNNLKVLLENKISILKNKNLKFDIITDEVDVIKYENGDFFERHTDFDKMISNVMKYYSLIIYLQKPIKGGHFCYYIKNKKYFAINNVILFRNNLDHESSLVEDGEKIILKINVKCSPIIEEDDYTIEIITNKYISENTKNIIEKLNFMYSKKTIDSEFILCENIKEFKDYMKAYRKNSNIIPFSIIMKDDKFFSFSIYESTLLFIEDIDINSIMSEIKNIDNYDEIFSNMNTMRLNLIKKYISKYEFELLEKTNFKITTSEVPRIYKKYVNEDDLMKHYDSLGIICDEIEHCLEDGEYNFDDEYDFKDDKMYIEDKKMDFYRFIYLSNHIKKNYLDKICDDISDNYIIKQDSKAGVSYCNQNDYYQFSFNMYCGFLKL